MPLIIAIAVLAFLPSVLPNYYVGLVVRALIFAIFAMSLDLLMGYTGLPSLGHAAFLGVAAYAVGIFTLRVMNNLVISLTLGLVAAVIIAAVFGLLVLRSRGPQFLMLTLALSQVLWGIAFNWRSVTHGDDGLTRIPRPALGSLLDLNNTTNFYYLTLIFFVVSVAILYLIVNSPFGFSLEGIRESETRMSALGYNVWLHQYLAYLISGLFAGLAGVLSAYYDGFVSPADLHIVTSAKVILMVVLGGAGTLFGPILGAAAIVFLENLVSAYTQRWLSVLGIIYVLVVLFAQGGLYVLLRRNLRRWVTR